mmetsp:Transcript_56351/g.123462  ORF Transcript_56351/g.123462 Transcript_56351/m.123462 type:complete len:462 (-) Transcript_56351:73-1458(-)
MGGRVIEWDPPLELHLLRVRVHRGVPGHPPGEEEELGALGDLGPVRQDVVRVGHLIIQRHRGIQAEGLVQQGVQHGHVGGGHPLPVRLLQVGQLLINLRLDPLLNLRVGPQDVKHPGQRAGRGIPASNHKVQHGIAKVRCELGVGHEALGFHRAKEPGEEVLAVGQLGVFVALGHNAGGLRVQQIEGLAELLVALAAIPLPAHSQAVQAAEREGQELAEVRWEQRLHHVLHERPVSRVEGCPVVVALPAQGIGVHPEEQVHNTVHSVVEEMCLHVHLLPGLDNANQAVGSVHKSLRHGGGHIGPGENLRGNLPLPSPVLPSIHSPDPVRGGEDSPPQPLAEGELDNPIVGLRLGVHVEFVLQVVLNQFRVPDGQGNEGWVPKDPRTFGYREPQGDLIAPVVPRLGEVPLGFHRPQQPVGSVSGSGHVLEHPAHPEAGPKLPGQGAQDLHGGEPGVNHQASA